ncbi:SUR7/PalI family-domain-containing protein [Sporodiniella umbellata]|nr:SUR7/PalI family-domain-containing protein [Sporodiniella umbellata]
MSRYVLGLLASFFLFASFILGLFILIGQLSNRPFINLISFVRAFNPRYDLSYDFGLWSYCQGKAYSPIESCSKAIPAYNWAATTGFDQMLPRHSSSKTISRVFTANFILYFIGAGLSFLLWLASLPSLCCKQIKNGQRVRSAVMSSLTGFTFLVMLAALVMGLVLVIGSVKAIGNASEDWQGHAGIAIWFTIGSVVSLFLAFICYTIRTCIKPSRRTTAERYEKPFELPTHDPVGHTPQPAPTEPYNHLTHSSSMSQQYSPNLNIQYLSPIYNSGRQHT